MAKEYIPKDELEQALRKEAAHLLRYYKRYLSVSDVVNELIGVVRRFPATDVIEVRHGRWVSVQHKLARVCSVCNRDEPYKFADVDADAYNYCPNCGAYMMGENNE